jgi:hypothetical protein
LDVIFFVIPALWQIVCALVVSVGVNVLNYNELKEEYDKIIARHKIMVENL